MAHPVCISTSSAPHRSGRALDLSTMRTPREREIDTTKDRRRRGFSAAGVRLSGIRDIPMVLHHETWLEPEDTIDLFGRDPEAKRYGAQVFIQIYPLPEGLQLFRREWAFYRRQKRSFLVEGKKFENSLLLPQSLASALKRESFQMRDGAYRRRIVHIAEFPSRAIIMVYPLNAARFASSSFFQQVRESLEIDDQ
jgi:hypothetical protein